MGEEVIDERAPVPLNLQRVALREAVQPRVARDTVDLAEARPQLLRRECRPGPQWEQRRTQQRTSAARPRVRGRVRVRGRGRGRARARPGEGGEAGLTLALPLTLTPTLALTLTVTLPLTLPQTW